MWFCFADEMGTYPAVDYTEKRSLPISIPDYRYIDHDGERFVVKPLSLPVDSPLLAR